MNSLAINQFIPLNIINLKWFRFPAVQRLFSWGGGGVSWLRFTESEIAVSHFTVNKIGI